MSKNKDTGMCFYCMYWLLGTLVYLDANLPCPGCRGEGLECPTGQGSLPSFKEGEGGRRVSGRARGEWMGGGSVNL